jgi:hypothetical protein
MYFQCNENTPQITAARIPVRKSIILNSTYYLHNSILDFLQKASIIKGVLQII